MMGSPSRELRRKSPGQPGSSANVSPSSIDSTSKYSLAEIEILNYLLALMKNNLATDVY